jgi:hypothetical protein
MRNPAFPANSARIRTRALPVRPLAAAAPPPLKSLGSSTFNCQFSTANPSSQLTDHRTRITNHSSPFTSHLSLPTSHDSRFTNHGSLLLLTSNSLRAITYATVRNCSFQRTLSLAPATLTRYPTPNSFPAITYEYRGGGGVATRVRNLLKTNNCTSGHAQVSPSNAQVDSLAFHQSPAYPPWRVTSHKSLFPFHSSLVTRHSSRESS